MNELPLAGVRVLDLTWVVSGPVATRILADLGAEVFKVEARSAGTQSRNMTFNPRVMATAGFFQYFNRNKVGLSLNMRSDEGKVLFRRLLKLCDVVICNFSAHVMERWGFDYEGLKAERPDIIYVSMPGFGHSGRHQDYRSNGPTIQALSGQTFAIGLPDRESAGWGYSYMDHTAGYNGAAAVLQALYHRRRTGEGQFIDLAQLEAAVSLMGTYLLDYDVNGRPLRRQGMPQGNRAMWDRAAPHGVYRCQGEDRWCAVTVFTEEEWNGFRRALGNPSWASEDKFSTLDGRMANQDELDAEVESWTAAHTQQEVMDTLQAEGVPAGMVQDPRQRADEDPQLKARDHIVTIKVPSGKMDDVETVRVDSFPATIATRSHDEYTTAPTLGEHNRYVFGEVLGMSAEEIADYTKRGII